MSAEIIKLLEEQKDRVPVEAYRKGLEYAIQAIKQANQPKEQQKQALIDMMKGDEELGVYENALREAAQKVVKVVRKGQLGISLFNSIDEIEKALKQ